MPAPPTLQTPGRTPTVLDWLFWPRAYARLVLLLLTAGLVMSITSRPGALGPVWLLVMSLAVGWTAFLMDGPKEVVTYLRHFGSPHHHDRIQSLAESRLKRRFRFLTLGDGVYPASGPGFRMVSASLGLLALGLFLALNIDVMLGVVVPLFVPGGPPPRGITFPFWVLTAVAAAVSLVAVMGFWTTLIPSVTSRRILERVQRGVRLSTTTLGGLTGFFSGNWVLAADDAHWKDLVSFLLVHSRAVVIDVSVPTPHLVWEMQQAAAVCPEKVVFVGDATQVQLWTRPPTTTVEDDALALLEGADVLVFRGPDWSRTFSAALASRLSRIDRDVGKREDAERLRRLWTWATGFDWPG